MAALVAVLSLAIFGRSLFAASPVFLQLEQLILQFSNQFAEMLQLDLLTAYWALQTWAFPASTTESGELPSSVLDTLSPGDDGAVILNTQSFGREETEMT